MQNKRKLILGTLITFGISLAQKKPIETDKSTAFLNSPCENLLS